MTKKQLNEEIKGLKLLAISNLEDAKKIMKLAIWLDRALTDRKTRLAKKSK